MVFLLFFAVDATIQLLWLRPKTFFTTKRTVIKVVILVVLFTDAFVVVCRGVIHVRVLRCLRPFYFIDCYVTSGVRRSVFFYEARHTLQPVGRISMYDIYVSCGMTCCNRKYNGKTMQVTTSLWPCFIGVMVHT